MPSIELSKLTGVSAVRSVGGSDRAQASNVADKGRSQLSAGKASGVTLEVGTAIEAGQPPVDSDRVEQIRAALRDGSYPLIPTKIADAMIAARLSIGGVQ